MKKKMLAAIMSAMMAFAVVGAVAVTPSTTVLAEEVGGDPAPEEDVTVSVTIDNSASNLVVYFYPSEADLTNPIIVGVGEKVTVEATEDITARIRLYLAKNGYFLPEDYEGPADATYEFYENEAMLDGDLPYKMSYSIEIAPNSDDNRTQTITIPAASLCTHPKVQDFYVYYNVTPDGHVQYCYDCQTELSDTYTSHTFSEMTVAEYLDWIFSSEDYSDTDSEIIATLKSQNLREYEEEGLTADTLVKVCKSCLYMEKSDNQHENEPAAVPPSDPADGLSEASTASVLTSPKTGESDMSFLLLAATLFFAGTADGSLYLAFDP
jgi:hypothetical protein